MSQILSRSVSALLHRSAGTSLRRWFRLVTPALDSHGTIIRPEGVKTARFEQNPVFLWMHESGGFTAPSPDVVIGRVVEWEQSEDAFDILVEFDEGSPLAMECFRKVCAGLLRMVSIGFRVLREHTEDIDGRKGVPIYDEVELLEASLVIIGSNPEALALERQRQGGLMSRITAPAPSSTVAHVVQPATEQRGPFYGAGARQAEQHAALESIDEQTLQEMAARTGQSVEALREHLEAQREAARL